MTASTSAPDFVSLADLDDALLDRLAEAHREALPTGLAELGPRAARDFYLSARSSEHLFGFAALEGRRVLGGVVGSPEPDRAFEALTKHPLRFLVQAGLHNPKVLPQMVWSKLFPAHGAARPDASADLMYVFTPTAARGRGVGRGLVQAFCTETARRGLAVVTLSVETDNGAAIGLYEKLGFRVTAPAQHEGRHFRLRMARDVDEADSAHA